MIISMDKVFRLHVVQNSKDPKKIRFEDPYEVRKWSKIVGVAPKEIIASFSFYILKVLKLRVQHSIETQTLNGRSMRSIYTELSLKYKKQNPKNIGRFWKDTEFLMNNMKVYQDGNTIKMGIPKGVKHPTNGVEAYLIFQWLEFGTKRKGKYIIPPRPLIVPHLRFIFKNIGTYFIKFLEIYYKVNANSSSIRKG